MDEVLKLLILRMFAPDSVEERSFAWRFATKALILGKVIALSQHKTLLPCRDSHHDLDLFSMIALYVGTMAYA